MYQFNLGSSFDAMLESLTKTWEGFLDSEPVSRLPTTFVTSAFPPCDMYVDEKTGSLHFEAAVAGYEEKDISIRYENDYLLLEMSQPLPKEGRKYLQKAIRVGNVKSKYFVPSSRYDASGISASLKDGILKVTIPVRESAKPISILLSK